MGVSLSRQWDEYTAVLTPELFDSGFHDEEVVREQSTRGPLLLNLCGSRPVKSDIAWGADGARLGWRHCSGIRGTEQSINSNETPQSVHNPPKLKARRRDRPMIVTLRRPLIRMLGI